MHYPEMWGLIQFTNMKIGTMTTEFAPEPSDSARWALREVYYAEKNYFNRIGYYTAILSELNIGSITLRDFVWPPKIEAATNIFEATIQSADGKSIFRIAQDGKVTMEAK